ncbi:MAG: AAA family ATPase [Bifidobacteriaceae bacterium]|jgi:ATP-dependent exoDNAse (exonuclease V) alpha subunit|nr:AAA family ATPase [Bifidobacteriaceae bacterium]
MNQDDALKLLLETNDNYFITGRAGTGKSYLLNRFRKITPRQHVVLAPTGIAAINVNGQTIHSFFKLRPLDGLQNPDRFGYNMRENHIRLLRKIEVLIIDEISMVPPDIISVIDKQLRVARHNTQPFGGVQLLLFGDLFQLPPVTPVKTILKNDEPFQYDLNRLLNEKYGGVFFFNAPAIQRAGIKMVELQKIYRQSDPIFLKLLNQIREGQHNRDTVKQINARVNPEPANFDTIVIASHRHTVDLINSSKLASIDQTLWTFEAEHSGYTKSELDRQLAPLTLRVKVGAKVMTLINDPAGRFVNGNIGTVLNITNQIITVQIGNKKFEIHRHPWNKMHYTADDDGKIVEKPKGRFVQFPLTLAWAVTIHKSQGMTYDAVVIEPRGIFDNGQLYVALSRATNLQRLYLKSPILPQHISVHPEVVKFTQQLRAA